MTRNHNASLSTIRRPAARRAARGFGLVELMVSIVIGLTIVAALTALFINTSGSNRELARANSMIENGRLAMEVLEGDVIHAGYWGTYLPSYDDQTFEDVPTDAPTAVPDPCLDWDTPWDATFRANLVHIPLQVYDSDAVCGDVIQDKVAGTDVLVVRHAELCEAGSGGNCEDVVNGKLYFQSSRCEDEVPAFVLDANQSLFTLMNIKCDSTDPDEVTELRKFVSNIYYVRDYAVTPGDGIPTLVRSQFDLAGGVLAHQPAEALVEGIEGFRVELGIDDRSKAYTGFPTGSPVDYGAAVAWYDPKTRTIPTNRGDGSPDGAFVSCTTAAPCTLEQLRDVTAVKFYLLVRSRDPSPAHTDTKTYNLGTTVMGPYDDAFKRHVYVTTVRLPNVAGRRQTP